MVLSAGKPVGRLYVARLPEAVRVVNIALTTANRGRGWGSTLLKKVIAEAERHDLPVRLHVEAENRARLLYQRLGFRVTGRKGFYLCMERAVRAS